VVGVGGPHIRGLNTNGGFELGNRMREITREDVRTAVERARAIERPPIARFCTCCRASSSSTSSRHLRSRGHGGRAARSGSAHRHLLRQRAAKHVTCANRAGLEVTEAVLESIAAAEATLSADERELGVCLLDIGAHSSDLAVFFEGAVAHTASVPIGGAHFTNDLAVGLQMPVAQAEELKRQYGNAVVTAVPQEAEIEIANPQPQRCACA
jgi:cell division protein FtsA